MKFFTLKEAATRLGKSPAEIRRLKLPHKADGRSILIPEFVIDDFEKTGTPPVYDKPIVVCWNDDQGKPQSFAVGPDWLELQFRGFIDEFIRRKTVAAIREQRWQQSAPIPPPRIIPPEPINLSIRSASEPHPEPRREPRPEPQDDAELSRVIAAWPSLPVAFQRAILAIVDTSLKTF